MKNLRTANLRPFFQSLRFVKASLWAEQTLDLLYIRIVGGD